MSIPIDFHSTETCELWIRALLFFSLAISSFQNLYNAAQYSSRGLLAWKFLKYAYQRPFFESKIFDVLFSTAGFITLNSARIALVLVGAASLAVPEVLTALFVLQVLLYIRAFLVTSAADQLNTIILFFLLVCAWCPNPAIQTLSLCAMAIHTLFCYFANGLIKLLAHRWRDGSHLKSILLTENYSRKWLARQIDKRQIAGQQITDRQITRQQTTGRQTTGIPGAPPAGRISKTTLFKWLSSTVIGWEVSAVLVPFLPEPLVWIFLAFGLCFHAVVGTVMGLNTFFWTFVSTYPAILFLAQQVDKLVQ